MSDPRLVIQAHEAAGTHYDLRLEIDGVLKSWSIPRGPSTNPRVKRLAIPTEDKPVEFADFEGVVTEAGPGAGAVQIWDTGTYQNLKNIHGRETMPMTRELERGEILIRLNGVKLRGSYALIRFKKQKDDSDLWLLVKMRDEFASVRSKPKRDVSAVSGRSMAKIKAAKPGT
jgi:DNA ligase D-like protein (predicted 3'-phosphoesterase)